MQKFINEDALSTFEGWLAFQNFDVSSPDELDSLREVYADLHAASEALPKFGRMKLRPMEPGEYRYAVALREGANLWLNLWVRRSPKSEFFVMIPRNQKDIDLHASYHASGTLHVKIEGRKQLTINVQRPDQNFQGNQPLFTFSGYSPKRIGAVCDPTDFSDVIEEPGVLGPHNGQITIDLVEPNTEPPSIPWVQVVRRKTYRDSSPWVVITVASPENRLFDER